MNTTLPFSLKNYLNDRRGTFNRMLDKFVQQNERNERPIVNAMRYALMGDGKRLRPLLCIAAAEAVGGNIETALPAACALEMIHTYSLIHDDLPAMDDDDRRRGKPTCHLAFDEATAILAGDALLTLAFEVLTATSNRTKLQFKAIQIISRAAGYQGMVEGQMMDIQSEGNALTIGVLERLYRLKTGALIEASVETGAVLAEGEPGELAHLKTYADCIGLAFQITDDILNVEGDPKIMGKNVGTDEVRSKNTYPALIGLAASKTIAEDLVKRALKSLVSFDSKAAPLRAIAEYIVKRNR